MSKPLWQCASCEATARGTSVARSRRRRALCTWCDEELVRSGYDWCPRGRHKVKVADMLRSGKMCKACERARSAAFPRDVRAYGRAWRARNRDTVLASLRAYRAQNRARLNAYSYAYYWKDPEAARERTRRRRARLRPLMNSQRRQRYRRHADRERASTRRRYDARKIAILKDMQAALGTGEAI